MTSKAKAPSFDTFVDMTAEVEEIKEWMLEHPKTDKKLIKFHLAYALLSRGLNPKYFMDILDQAGEPRLIRYFKTLMERDHFEEIGAVLQFYDMIMLDRYRFYSSFPLMLPQRNQNLVFHAQKLIYDN